MPVVKPVSTEAILECMEMSIEPTRFSFFVSNILEGYVNGEVLLSEIFWGLPGGEKS